MEAINAKVANLSEATLKEMAIALFNDVRDGSEIVLSAVLDRLMAIMTEAAFVDFCEGIDA